MSKLTEQPPWGISVDDAVVDYGYSTKKEAVEAADRRPAAGQERGLVTPMCPDHEGQPMNGCRECFALDADGDSGRRPVVAEFELDT